MKKWITYLKILFTCAVMFVPASVHAQQNNTEAFVIDYYELELTVGETGVIDVLQNLSVTFSEERHGIYLDIPTHFSMEWVIDGQTFNRQYRFPVSNIKVEGHDFKVDSYSKGKRIRIGSADSFVSGEVDYQVSYTIKTSDLDLNGKQMLYYNLIAPAWNTQIKAASFTITMPKAFDKNNVNFYFGEYGSDMKQYANFQYEVVGSTIYANLASALNPLEGITIQVDLTNDYFAYPKPVEYTGFIVIFSLILTIVIALLFFKYGKDDVVIKTVEFAAPEGVTCASMSYILDGEVSANDVLSLIIEWANMGYLSIEEIGSDNLFLKKEMDMGDERARYEKRLFKSLFESGDEVHTKDLQESFYANIHTAITGIKHYHTKNKARHVFTNSSMWMQGFSMFLAIVPTFLGMLDSLNKVFYSFPLALLVSFLLTLIGIGIIAFAAYSIQTRVSLSKGKAIAMFVTATICAVLYFMVYYFIIMIGSKSQPILISGIISTVVIATCSFFMDKRTQQGMIWYGKILGLKDFIMTAEKDRLVALVQDNPQYFYHILPYAYVLGISDVWSKKFTNIIMDNAKWYRSDEVVPVHMFMPRYYRSMTTLRQLNTLPQISTSSKGGGNFTSGSGGGGFSGGGFGGGGGGSW